MGGKGGDAGTTLFLIGLRCVRYWKLEEDAAARGVNPLVSKLSVNLLGSNAT